MSRLDRFHCSTCVDTAHGSSAHLLGVWYTALTESCYSSHHRHCTPHLQCHANTCDHYRWSCHCAQANLHTYIHTPSSSLSRITIAGIQYQGKRSWCCLAQPTLSIATLYKTHQLDERQRGGPQQQGTTETFFSKLRAKCIDHFASYCPFIATKTRVI